MTDDPINNDVEKPLAEESSAEAGEPITSAAGAAKTASRALKDTAQKYFDAAGIEVDSESIEQKIRDYPLLSLALAAGTGFVVGGGLATSPGMMLLGLFGRKAAVEAATNFGRRVFRQVAGDRM
jgi:hypothetical protein